MKKFCNKCGNQLDLGKRACVICNAFNPYFIAGFTPTSNDESANSSVSEKQFNGAVTEQPVVKNDYAADLVRMRREQLEQQRAEQELKNELQKVKEETEQYKRETIELVTEVKKELQDIENENKLLKEKVESLKANPAIRNSEPPVTIAQVAEHKTASKKGITVLIVSGLVILVTAASWMFFHNSSNNPASNTASLQPVMKPEIIKDVKNEISRPVTKNDTVPAKKLIAVATYPAAAKPVTPSTVTVVQPVKKPATEGFSLTETKLKADLVGKKLSGCDVTITSASEINSISNLVLVDRLSASYLKYKCIVKIKQGNEAYTSSPYIYYSAEGSFIKVDGTNCE